MAGRSEPQLKRELARRVKSRRQRLGITQEKLAEQAGMHRTYVGDIEQALPDIGFLKLVQLADGLGIDPGDLTRGMRL